MTPDDIRPALEVMMARAHRQAADVRAVGRTVERAKQRGDRAVIVLRVAPEHTMLVAAGWYFMVRGKFRRQDVFAIDLVPYRGCGGVDLSAVCKIFIRQACRFPRRIPTVFGPRVDLFHRIVRDRKILVVRANADLAAQVRPFIAGAPGSTVISTSRRVLGGWTRTAPSSSICAVTTPSTSNGMVSHTTTREREPMSDHDVEDDDYFFGLDFLKKHGIGYNACDMGVYEYAAGPRRLWAVRIERRDVAGRIYDWTWISTTKPDASAPDWDDEIFLKVRDATDGRLSFDAYITENFGGKSSGAIDRDEYEMWVADTAIWFQAREFLGWDHTLIESFLSVVPNEI